MICFICALNFLVNFLNLNFELWYGVSGDIQLMGEFTVLVLLFFQFFVVLLIFLSDSLNFIIFVCQNRKTILFKILYLLFKSSLDVLSVIFTWFCFSQKLFNFSLFLLYSLEGELFFLFKKLDSMIILICYRIVFHWPLSIKCF